MRRNESNGGRRQDEHDRETALVPLRDEALGDVTGGIFATLTGALAATIRSLGAALEQAARK